jgi:hypothetical protein
MAITRLGGANAITGTIPQGNIANASLGAVTALPAAISTGKALQIISTPDVGDLSQASTNSTTYADISGVDLVLTPTASSSKFLLFVSYNIDTGGDGHGLGARLTYNHSGISQTEVDDRYGNSNFHITADRANTWQSMNYYLAPSTTNEITFRLQIATGTGGETAYFNRGTLRIMAVEYA